MLQFGKGSSVVQADGFYQLWVRNNLPAAIIINVPEPVIVSSAVASAIAAAVAAAVSSAVAAFADGACGTGCIIG